MGVPASHPPREVAPGETVPSGKGEPLDAAAFRPRDRAPRAGMMADGRARDAGDSRGTPLLSSQDMALYRAGTDRSPPASAYVDGERIVQSVASGVAYRHGEAVQPSGTDK